MRTPALTVSAARQEDLPALLDLERSGFEPAEQWSLRSWQGELVGAGRRVLLARTAGVVGAITLQLTDRDADLHRLVVAPEVRRQGVGTALLKAGLTAVRLAGARSVLLEVRFDNDAAIQLYQSAGFEQLAARTDYYGPGRHALILKYWDLQGKTGSMS